MVNGDYDKARRPGSPVVARTPKCPAGRRLAVAIRRVVGPPGTSAAQAEDVHRPGAGPEIAQAVAHRIGGHALCRPRRRLEVVAEREPGGERRGVRAARPVRGAPAVARAGDLDDAFP